MEPEVGVETCRTRKGRPLNLAEVTYSCLLEGTLSSARTPFLAIRRGPDLVPSPRRVITLKHNLKGSQGILDGRSRGAERGVNRPLVQKDLPGTLLAENGDSAGATGGAILVPHCGEIVVDRRQFRQPLRVSSDRASKSSLVRPGKTPHVSHDVILLLCITHAIPIIGRKVNPVQRGTCPLAVTLHCHSPW